MQDYSSYQQHLSPQLTRLSSMNSSSILAEYQMMKHLGGGSSAEVIQALHIPSNRLYAIKRIHKYKLRDEKLAMQIRLEIQLMKEFDHPNIIRLQTTFEDQEYLNIVMELAEMSLYDKLQHYESFPEEKVVLYIRDVINALEYMHNRDNPIIHRDIKPENIVITKDGICKLTDFGVSNRLQCKGGTRQTSAGTFSYMAPQIDKKMPYDESIDLWCMGILIYELLTGVNPFIKMEEKDAEKIQFPKGFPPLARDVVKRLLRMDPRQRMTLPELKNHVWIKTKINEGHLSATYQYPQETKLERLKEQITVFRQKLKKRREEQQLVEQLEQTLIEKTKQIKERQFKKSYSVNEEIELMQYLSELKIQYRINIEKIENRKLKYVKKAEKAKKEESKMEQEIEYYKVEIKKLKQKQVKQHIMIVNKFNEAITKLQEMTKKLQQYPERLKAEVLYFKQPRDTQPREWINIEAIKLTNKLLKRHKNALEQRREMLIRNYSCQ